MAVVDWTDACARAAALRTAYFALISGGGESLIRYRGPEGEREVRYQAANISILKTELQSAEAECAALTGTVSPNRRFAIRAGARRDCPRRPWNPWDI